MQKEEANLRPNLDVTAFIRDGAGKDDGRDEAHLLVYGGNDRLQQHRCIVDRSVQRPNTQWRTERMESEQTYF